MELRHPCKAPSVLTWIPRECWHACPCGYPHDSWMFTCVSLQAPTWCWAFTRVSTWAPKRCWVFTRMSPWAHTQRSHGWCQTGISAVGEVFFSLNMPLCSLFRLIQYLMSSFIESWCSQNSKSYHTSIGIIKWKINLIWKTTDHMPNRWTSTRIN